MDWKKFLFSFEGRVSRKAYWLFVIASFVLSMIINVVALAPMMAAIQSGDPEAAANVSMPIWIWIITIPLIWISFAIYAKRWHDFDKSGWLSLLFIIPFVNFIVFIVLGVIPGTPGPNRFGEGPMA